MDTTTTTPATSTPVSAPSASPSNFSLTPAAIAQVKEVIKAQGFEGYYLVVRVVPAGCSGLGYDLNLIKDTKDGDVTWEQDGVKMATDGMSLKYLGGTSVDFVQNDTMAGFKFNNPNAKSSCGCGTSFST